MWRVNLVLAFLGVVYGSQQEVDLVRHLLDPVRYDPQVLPAKDVDKGVTVEIDISLFQLIALDNVEQTLDIKVWTRMTWVDEKLTWNASEYGGVDSIRLKATNIWRPDIAMYTELKQISIPDGEILPLVVRSDGHVQWNFPNLIHSACTIYIDHFPWDRQACPLTYGSWTYNQAHVNLINMEETGDLSNAESNSEFEIRSLSVRRHVTTFPSGESFPVITFWLVLDRKPMYYTFNIMMPAIFITCLCLLGFILPPDSGERVSLSVTVMLSITVFLLLITEVIPTQSDAVPQIGIYFGAIIILMAVNVAITILVLALYHNGKYKAKVPSWCRKLFLTCLPKYVCFGKSVKNNLSGYNANPEKEGSYVISNNGAGYVNHNFQKEGAEPADGDDSEVDDWMLLAVVIDRIFLIIFFVFIFVLTVIIFATAATHGDIEEFVDSLDTYKGSSSSK